MLLALVLIGSVLSGRATTARALAAVEEGTAAALLGRVQVALRDRGRPTADGLQEIFTELEPEGLRYLAFTPPARSPIEVGQARLRATARPGRVGRGQGRVRLTVPLLPPRPGQGGAGRPPGPGPGPGPGRGPPPELTLEVESAMAAGLMQDAQRSVWAGLSAGGVLLLLGPLLVYLLRQRRRLEAARAEQAQLAALGRMSGVIAHELKNPLASLKGHAQLLLEQVDEPRAAKKAQRVVGEAERIEALVRGLLEFLRSGRVEARSVDVAELLRRVVQGLPSGAEVTLDVGADVGRLEVDPDRMRQVIENLVDNAREAAPDRGVEVAARRSRGDVEITVRDHGPGIEGDVDVFEPFVTTKTHGTGLGLSVARAIVQAHGGRIEAEPAQGGGTVVRITLPT